MKKHQQGFTLVETLVAILLLLGTIVPITYIVSGLILTSRSQHREITAQYLLQDAVEYIRNNRDSALNTGTPWADYTQMGPSCPSVVGFANVTSICPCIYLPGQDGECMVDSIYDSVSQCPPGGCLNIIREINSGISPNSFLCTPGQSCLGLAATSQPTPYIRSVRIEPNGDEIFVSAKVKWYESGVLKEKSINTSLFNW